MPQNEAGARVEPPVSLPTAISHMPSATATAPPEVEPPGTRARSAGLAGVPKCGLVPMPWKANSLMLVLATITAPARRSRCTATASATAGLPSSARMREPARVTSPATSNRSLMVTMAPSSGPERAAGALSRVGGVGRGPRLVGIDGKAGAGALARGIGDARQRLFQAVAAQNVGHRRIGPVENRSRYYYAPIAQRMGRAVHCPDPSRHRNAPWKSGRSYRTSSFGYRVLTLNRPQRLNAFTEAMHEALAAALYRCRAPIPTCRALMITGAGRAFSSGQDLGERMTPDGDVVVPGAALERYYNPLVRRLRALPFPVVAAVNGTAAGAGCNIALACDIVLAARSASFVQSFAGIGPRSGFGRHLAPAPLVGRARARGLALTAEPLTAETGSGSGA